ncbi:hypothetical protein [Acidithiobacillus sp.]|uniref:hypothetical protein n=1 Tax=Acidithiobacillus sp. TaxID=1872118 RepID=UPI00258F6BB1|nr:hypothetical protein [Acidithiobacillus sp.]MDD5375164.1 hypothetical protein [Acidithiobacillus sp.]
MNSGAALEIHHLETFWVAPVPDRDRCMHPGMPFVIWVLGSRLGSDARDRCAPLWDGIVENFTMFVSSGTLI